MADGDAKCAWLTAFRKRRMEGQIGAWRDAHADAGVPYGTVCHWEETCPEFRRARAALASELAERHEVTADAIASGAVTATTAQIQALQMRLRALRPAQYRDSARVEVTGANGGAVRLEDGSASRAAEMLARFAAAARRPVAALPAPDAPSGTSDGGSGDG